MARNSKEKVVLESCPGTSLVKIRRLLRKYKGDPDEVINALYEEEYGATDIKTEDAQDALVPAPAEEQQPKEDTSLAVDSFSPSPANDTLGSPPQLSEQPLSPKPAPEQTSLNEAIPPQDVPHGTSQSQEDTPKKDETETPASLPPSPAAVEENAQPKKHPKKPNKRDKKKEKREEKRLKRQHKAAAAMREKSEDAADDTTTAMRQLYI